MRLLTISLLALTSTAAHALPHPANFPQCTPIMQKESLRFLQEQVNHNKPLPKGPGVKLIIGGEAYNDWGDATEARYMNGYWFLDDKQKRHFITDVAVHFNKNTCEPIRSELINFRDLSDQVK